MFKIHSQLNKETLLIMGVAAVLLVLTLFTVVSLVPALIDVYQPESKSVNLAPIDADLVNKALNYLNKDNK